MVYSKNNKGFTLVELAIVLVIIALVVAGILSGQTMIQNARLISVYDDINKFTTAFNSFRDSYRAIPGDLDPLPGASFNGVDAVDTVWGTGAKIRNNGSIEWLEALDDGTNKANESSLFWQHLFIAGLNDFNPKFSSYPYTYYEEGRETAPRSKIQGGGYKALSYDTNGFVNSRYVIELHPSQALFATNPLLSAQDAFFLDSKYDDGKPLTGSIWFVTGWATFSAYADCLVTLVTGNQDYKVDSATADKKSCTLVFNLPK
jgi:prepilin-type N-terminal cleavage/methylation domain-containing protein